MTAAVSWKDRLKTEFLLGQRIPAFFLADKLLVRQKLQQGRDADSPGRQ